MFYTHGILGSLIIGLIIGAIAKAIVPGKDPAGCVFTIGLGLFGSLIGGFLGQMLFGPAYVAHWIASIIGAVILLLIYHAIFRRPGI